MTVSYRLLAGTGAVATSDTGVGDTDAYRNPLEGSVVFAAGETSKTVSYRIDADSEDEVDEAVVLEVFSATNASLAGDAPVLRATGWILDDDGTGNNLALFVSSPVVLENAPNGNVASFEVSLSRPAPEDLDFAFTTVPGSATPGEDFEPRSGTISFTRGQTTTAVNVPILGDDVPEPDEIFTLDVMPTTALASGEAGTDGIGTIRDNERVIEQPVVSIAVEPDSADESEEATVTFTLTRTGDASTAVTANLTRGGSASPGADFTGSVPSSVVFAAGETEKTFTVQIQDDANDEADETLIVTIASLSRADHEIGTATATHVIEDDDVPPPPELSISNGPTQAEGDAGVTTFDFTVTRSGDTSAASSAAYAVAGVGVTPADADDFGGTFPGGIVEFEAGETMATITVEVTGDTEVGANEDFVITLSNPTNATISDAQGVATIRNDDEPPAPTISIVDGPTQAEGDAGTTSFQFTVTRSGPLAAASSVGFAVIGLGPDPADAADFAGGVIPTGVVSFAAGESSQTVTIQVAGDLAVEPDERFAVVLANDPTNGVVVDDTGEATIRNDDPPVTTEPPVARDDAFATDEETAIGAGLNLFLDNGSGEDSDADGDAFEIVAAETSGGAAVPLGVATDLPQGGRLTVEADGSFSFDPNGDFESLGAGDAQTVSFSYTIEDAEGGQDEAEVEIAVAGVNDDPVVTTGPSFTVDENQTAVGFVTAEDVDNPASELSFSILPGGDGDLFEIDADTGALSFLSPPDFEAPGDDDGDNVYALEVRVADPDGGEETRTLSVIVEDVEPEDGPMVIAGTSGIDYLTGEDAAEILRANGGPLDQVRGGGGGDVFEFLDIEGQRDVMRILDYSAEQGDVIDLGGAGFETRVIGGSSYLLLEGGDRDTVVVAGVDDPDQLTFA